MASLSQRGPADPAPAARAAGRGALILFEGLDRCGKSTQCQRLLDHLTAQQVPVQKLSFPDREQETGKLIGDFLQRKIKLDPLAVHLLFAANRQNVRQKMLDCLAAGITLVVDRYAYSGAAFTAAQLESPHPQGLDLDWCKTPDAGLPAPDVVIFLRLTPQEAAQRGQYGAEAYERVDFQEKVQQQFDRLRDSSWRELDALQNQDSIAQQINEIAAEAVQDCRLGKRPQQYLWQSAETPAASQVGQQARSGGQALSSEQSDQRQKQAGTSGQQKLAQQPQATSARPLAERNH